MKNDVALNGTLITHDKCEVYTNNLANAFKRNQRLLLLCFIATFAWGFLAHSYGFLHSSFSHDSLNEFNAEVFGNSWKIQLGRVFVPTYRFLVRSSLTFPWLIGILSLFFISLAVFWTVKLFKIRSTILTILISGIYTANITTIATTATYIHDLDSNMLSFAFAVLSVYLWKKDEKGFLYGMIPLCLSIGLYQSYISVTITLIILYLVMQLLDGEVFERVFKQGLKSILMILGGGMLFFVAMKAISHVSGIAIVSGNYNSMDTIFSLSAWEIVYTAIIGYLRTFYEILMVVSVYPSKMILAVHVILIAIPVIIVLCRVFQKEMKIKEKILTLILIALLPLSMNIIYPMTAGMSHDLMEFGYWFVYLFVLLIAWWAIDGLKNWKPVLKYGQQFVTVCLVFLVLWGNVQTANAAYLKKDLEQKANQALFTRIVHQMEICDGYVPGKTPVVFIGAPGSIEDIPGFGRISDIIGCGSPLFIYPDVCDYYRAYFDYVLLDPARIADPAIWAQMQTDNRVTDMPCYPETGSIMLIDNILVVKLGEFKPDEFSLDEFEYFMENMLKKIVHSLRNAI